MTIKTTIAGLAAVSLLALSACSADEEAEAAIAEEISPSPTVEAEEPEAEEAEEDAPAEEFAFGDGAPNEHRILLAQEITEAFEDMGYSVSDERLEFIGEYSDFNRPATTAEYFADPGGTSISGHYINDDPDGDYKMTEVSVMIYGEHIGLEADQDEEEAMRLTDDLVEAIAETSAGVEPPERVRVAVRLPGEPEEGSEQIPYNTIRGSLSSPAEVSWWG